MGAPRSRFQEVLLRIAITAAILALFLFIRPDIAALLLAQGRRLASPYIISTYLHQNTVRKLQIGAGEGSKTGWLNTDIDVQSGQAYLDAAKPFPVPDRSFRYIFGEHVIEHLTYEQALGMLKECHRVLEPGGKVRIATPNLLKFIELFQEPKTAEMRQFMKRKLEWHFWPQTPEPECYILNRQLRDWGHQFVYTPEMLRASFENAGFRDIREFRSGESDDPALAGLEGRSSDVNAYETMVFQGVRE